MTEPVPERPHETVHERDFAAGATELPVLDQDELGRKATRSGGSHERMRYAAELVTRRREGSEGCLARVTEKCVELVHRHRDARRLELAGKVRGRAVLAVAAGVARHVREPLEMAGERSGIYRRLHAGKDGLFGH